MNKWSKNIGKTLLIWLNNDKYHYHYHCETNINLEKIVDSIYCPHEK